MSVIAERQAHTVRRLSDITSEDQCEATVSPGRYSRERGYGDQGPFVRQCHLVAKYRIDGRRLCVRHAQEKALSIVLDEFAQ